MEKTRATSKHWFLTTALSFLGTPYLWGGDDPSGVDCSGLVVECLKAAGMIGEHEDFTAEGLFRAFGHGQVSSPATGCLLFLTDGNGRVYHVSICLDRWFCIGAGGGNVNTKSRSDAWRSNAYVKIRPIRFDPERMRVVYLF